MSYVSKIKHAFVSLKGTCINIGCGKDIRLGWINCDLFPATNSVRKFDITSSEDLSWLSETSSELIECNHVIGYINYTQALNFFYACFASLVKDGKLIIEFPDIIKISKHLIELDSDSIHTEKYIELIRAVYAYDHADAFNANFNKQTYIFGWSSNFVKKSLKDIGFSQVHLCSPLTHDQREWRDSRIEAIK